MGIKLFVISLRTRDIPQSIIFYRDIIGLPLALPHPERPHFNLGGAFLVILDGMSSQVDEPGDRFPVIAFEVDDFEGALSRMESAGIKLPWGVEQDSQRRWATFYDPGDNLIEIVARLDPEKS
jgi:catechol 2,3-dioxygenase-like lactoylglutathione lyase family enzyme